MGNWEKTCSIGDTWRLQWMPYSPDYADDNMELWVCVAKPTCP